MAVRSAARTPSRVTAPLRNVSGLTTATRTNNGMGTGSSGSPRNSVGRNRSGSNDEETISSKMMVVIDTLKKQQKKLEASSSKIEEHLKELCHANTQVKAAKANLPRELCATVREVYFQLTDEGDTNWDFTVSFDDPANKEFNKALIQNIQGVTKPSDVEQIGLTTIRRAVRTYFKTRKSRHNRIQSGKQKLNSACARRRQRRHNKAHARLRALKMSSTIDEATKQKVEPVLKAEYMSSEESVMEDTDGHASGSSSSESDGDSVRDKQKSHKQLIKHTLPWRSREFQRIIESLDRKMERRRNSRSKAMCLDVEIGEDSTREKPEALPDWAVELFA